MKEATCSATTTMGVSEDASWKSIAPPVRRAAHSRVNQRPARSRSAPVRPVSGPYRSRVVDDARAFSEDDTVDIAAASSAATINPARPAGKCSITKVASTSSLVANARPP